LRFASGDAEKRPKRNAHFAMRNGTLRRVKRKSLKSFRALNQSFRGIVYFQWLNPDFVSPFSGPWLRQVLSEDLATRLRIRLSRNTKGTVG
jgi:hypothetical protein